MSFCVGLPFELLTIRPTEHANGRMISFPRTAVSSVDALLEQRRGKDVLARFGLRPVTLFPVDLRRNVELEIMVSLAGSEAETLAGPRSGYYCDEDEEVATEQATSLIVAGGLSAEHEELLAAPTNAAIPSDDERSFESASRLYPQTDQELASAHVRFLRLLSRRIVLTDMFASLVGALVPELLRDEVMSYERAVALMERELDEQAAARAAG